MTEPTTLDRRARNLVRLELDDARDHGLGRRHAMKLRRLAEAGAAPGCRCDEQHPLLHRHACSYDDVISLLSATAPEPRGPEPPP
jgi:hypothetical protein